MNTTALPTVPRRAGRPTKFTPETVERILRCVERGMPLTLAASAAGVAFQSLCSYRNRHPRFDAAILEAIALGVEKRLKKIEAASEQGDWRASAWLLEHCQSEHFAKNRVEITGANGSALAVGINIYLPQKDAPDAKPSLPAPSSLLINEN